MTDVSPASSATMSPVSQLLSKLGMTREDLSRHSDQMRQFLVADSSPFAPERDRSPTPTPATSRGRAGSRPLATTGASTSSRRDLPAPITPARTVPAETSSSSGRKLDTMERVIELQNASRRGRRRYEDDDEDADSPLPLVRGSTPFSAPRRDPSMRTRASRCDARSGAHTTSTYDNSEDALPLPLTPSNSRHYRESVYDQTRFLKRGETWQGRTESPSPSRSGRNSAVAVRRGMSVDEPGTRSRGLSTSHGLPPFAGATPGKNHHNITAKDADQLPSSSPAASASSPRSSPPGPLVNIVSSPGPMGPSPDEEEYEDLPFKLPPGPYSSRKPDVPYAALIGQAILASPRHRLTLQEIYDFITIVWPHFQRNETTWMNSIRHVLSTTLVFRKVQRDRSAGRTLWAIWDEDIECFAEGGFRKEYCHDMRVQKERQTAAALARKQSTMDGTSTTTPKSAAAAAAASTSKTVSAGADDEHAPAGRKSKRAKRTHHEDVTGKPVPVPPAAQVPMVPAVVSYSAPLFPIPAPGSHHQPYYAFPFPAPTTSAADPQPTQAPPTAGVIFPPLPLSSAVAQHYAELYAASLSASSTPAPDVVVPEAESSEPPRHSTPPSGPPDSSDFETAPSTPQPEDNIVAISTDDAMSDSATAPVSEDPDDYLSYPDDEADTEITSPAPSSAPSLAASSSMSMSMSVPPPLTPNNNNSSSSPPEPIEEEDEVRFRPRLGKRKACSTFDYLPSPVEAPVHALDPCVTVGGRDDDEERHMLTSTTRARTRKERSQLAAKLQSKLPQIPGPPDSPTLMRQAARTDRMKTPPPRHATPHRTTDLPFPLKPFVTPPPRTTTPPRKMPSGGVGIGLQMSAQRTPLSHLGVHMSPSPSLAHYKSHLLPPPPPPPASPGAENGNGNTRTRTPSSSARRRSAGGIGVGGAFTPQTPRRLAFDSPFRTPSGSGFGFPLAYDPHDPGAALDEELNRLGARASGSYESPAGFFDRGRLYESPSGASPSNWPRLW